MQYFYVWAIWDEQSDAFTRKCLSAEGVVVIMYFWVVQAHEWDEMKKELEQVTEKTEEKEKHYDFLLYNWNLKWKLHFKILKYYLKFKKL